MNSKILKEHLQECLRKEVMMNEKSFTWSRVIHKAFKCPERRFNFWWRIDSYLYKTEKSLNKAIARKTNRNLIKKYNTEIQLPATIGPGLNVTHFLSVVINGCSTIGYNFKIRQNTTIGLGGSVGEKFNSPTISIGNNVEIGACCCVLGHELSIGNNVTIGAMSFINKDIPDDTVVYTEKTQIMRLK